MEKPVSFRVLMALALVVLFWGLNWPVLKIVLAEMAPLHFRVWCLVGGAAGLFALAAAGRMPLAVPPGQWIRLVLITLFNVLAWNLLVAYAVPLMDAGRASVLGFSMPIWGVLLSRLILGEPLTPRRLLGLALGIAGIALLVGGELRTAGRAPLGAMLMLGAAVAWAVGVIMMKRWQHLGMPATSFTAWLLLLAAVPVLLAVPFEDGSFLPAGMSKAALASLAYNVLICFIFCYWAWIRAVVAAPLVVSSLSTLMVPVIGVFSGMIVLGESPSWTDFLALALVVGALATVLLPQRAARP